MEWDLFVKIANESASEPLLSRVECHLQNEPLLDKRIFQCVEYSKSLNKDKRCVLVTNGTLLDKFGLTDIMQSGLDELLVSLNAYSKEMYQSINKGLDYDRVMKNIGLLLSDGSIKQKMALSFVVTEQSNREVYQAVQYWNKRGVKTRVMGLVDRAGALDNYERLRPKTGYHIGRLLYRLWRRLMFRLKGITGCPLPFYHMNILFNGDVIICCNDWNRATVVGNARTSSLREIWNSEKMNEIRRLILRKRYEEISSCKECSLIKEE